MYPILGQRHLNGRIILCSTKYVHPIKSRSVPADEFGSSAACILISNTFQPYVLHKYGKDPIIASRSQSGHDTKHLRSLLHQRYNCQKKGVTEQKKGTKTKIVFPFGLRRSSHPKSLSLQHVLCCCGILVGYVEIKLPRIKNRIWINHELRIQNQPPWPPRPPRSPSWFIQWMFGGL